MTHWLEENRMRRFTDKVAIVTGAGAGLGRRIATRLGSEGASVVVNDLDAEQAQHTANAVRQLSAPTLIEVCDVANEAQVARLYARAIDAFGRVDIVVNNAAILVPSCPIARTEWSEWDRVLRVNLGGVFLSSREAVRHMLPRKAGRIVNIASVVARDPNAGMGPYNVSKAGVVALTRTLAKEVGESGITVNAVAPGLMKDTPMTLGITPKELADAGAKLLVGRLGDPEEVAALVAFLASDEAGFLTGYCYMAAGGRGEY